MTKLLVALDIDGTILRHVGAPISSRVLAAVVAAHSAGHHIVLSTGRSAAATLPVAAVLGLDCGFAVCSNGAVTLRLDSSAPDGHSVVRCATFDPQAVLEALKRTWPSCVVAVEVPGTQGFRITETFPRQLLAGPVVARAWEELGVKGAMRVIFHAPGATAAAAMQMAEMLGLRVVEDASGLTNASEIISKAVSKAAALEALRVDLGVAVQHTVAIGDHANDIEMLLWAKRGVAMGQAAQAVKDAATEVTASVEDDGLAVALEPMIRTRMSRADPLVQD